MKIEEAIKRSSDVSMTREEAIQQLSLWKELWESKKAECDKYENREYAWEKKYMLNCNIEVCKIAIEALKQPERKKGRWEQQTEPLGWYEVECAVCSVCKDSFDLSEGYSIEDIRELFAYCPSCGAKMEEEECQLKDDTSHPFADDVLMGGDSNDKRRSG